MQVVNKAFHKNRVSHKKVGVADYQYFKKKKVGIADYQYFKNGTVTHSNVMFSDMATAPFI